MSIRQGNKLIAGSSAYSPSILDYKYTDHILNDMQWLRADPFSWHDGNTYAAAYKHLENELSTEGGWVVEYNSDLAGTWADLVWTGNNYIGLGVVGNICKSSDGDSWTTSTPLGIGAGTWGAIGMYGSTIVAVRTDGVVGTSSNEGSTWATTTVSNISSGTWTSMAWNGSKFVLIGSTGYISTSTNGTSWTAKTSVANLGNNKWQSIVWNGSQFLALSMYGYVSTSTNGTTWTAATIPTGMGSIIWDDCIWDGSKYIAFSRNGYMYSSTNGATWTELVASSVLGSYNWQAFVYNPINSKIVGIAGNGADGHGAIYGPVTARTETIQGTTITYYQAGDGHKIVLPNQESNVTAIYAATGSAWYYILDTTNQKFKLPRARNRAIVRSYNSGSRWYRLYADGWVEQGGYGAKNETITLPIEMANTNYGVLAGLCITGSNNISYSVNVDSKTTTSFKLRSESTVSTNEAYWEVSGLSVYYSVEKIVEYLYFYVGNFTQSAIENTAGIASETINTLSAHTVVEFQAPTSNNNYTWYRKYADGWVEQGGVVSNGSITTTWAVAVVFPVEMSDTNYSYQITPKLESFNTNGGTMGAIYQNTTTGFTVEVTSKYSNAGNTQQAAWRVEGMAA